MQTATKTQLIEWRHVGREYGFDGVEAIIDHPDHGRLYITDGFGGMDTPEGGSVRWRHGMAIMLKPDDTLEDLHTAPWNDYMGRMDALLAGYDDQRPVLDWPGYVVAKVAAVAGL